MQGAVLGRRCACPLPRTAAGLRVSSGTTMHTSVRSESHVLEHTPLGRTPHFRVAMPSDALYVTSPLPSNPKTQPADATVYTNPHTSSNADPHKS